MYVIYNTNLYITYYIYYHISDEASMGRIKAFVIIITVIYHNSFKPKYMVAYAYITIRKYLY